MGRTFDFDFDFDFEVGNAAIQGFHYMRRPGRGWPWASRVPVEIEIEIEIGSSKSMRFSQSVRMFFQLR